MEITLQVSLEFTIEVAEIHKVVEPGTPARRATRDQEKEESASHHFITIFAFAQLRAEMLENHGQRPRRIKKRSKI